MARRYVALAAAACLALGSAACGGDEPGGDDPAGDAAAAALEPSGTTAEAPPAPRDGAGNGVRRPAPGAPEEREEPERGRTARAGSSGGEAEGRRRSAERADRRREAELEVERVVRRIVGMISAADKRVCRTSFTHRYAQVVSGERGDAAFRRCEGDISRSKGTLEVVDFQETRVDGARASVRFRMRVPGAVTRQGWRLVRRGGGWLVDAKL